MAGGGAESGPTAVGVANGRQDVPGRRRRRWPVVVLAVLALLIGLLVVADRIAVRQAENRVAAKLATQKPFSARPAVRIHGFPFLTQAGRGVYRDIEVSGPGQGVGTLGPFVVDAHLRGVHIPLSEVSRDVRSVPVDRADVAITLALSALATATGVPGLTLQSDGNRVTARAPVAVPGLGTVPLSGTVALRISGGDVVGTITDLSAGGITLPAALAPAVGSALAVRVAVRDLPYDAMPTSVVVHGSTVTVAGSARNIVLR